MASTSAPCASGTHTASCSTQDPKSQAGRTSIRFRARTAPRNQAGGRPSSGSFEVAAARGREARRPAPADPTVHMQAVVCGRRGWAQARCYSGTHAVTKQYWPSRPARARSGSRPGVSPRTCSSPARRSASAPRCGKDTGPVRPRSRSPRRVARRRKAPGLPDGAVAPERDPSARRAVTRPARSGLPISAPPHGKQKSRSATPSAGRLCLNAR
jgi:hypothetical protein